MLQKFNWFSLRWGALVIAGSLLVDIEFLILNIGFCFFHISLGFKAIIKDYIHIEKIHLIFLTSVKICYLELIRHSIELFI
uniref:Succinate:cytochrome c oxidoreductase subunit 4 n=1 Tax=Gelidium vagum TaxID=35171 RepID=V5JG57_GELVA|nr:succinate:cytochrome c oxidoreductase subunit 4 [Gelidium vagum]AGO19323.1 succinate:cytochrome c oxidoreductase subunit 4 [Gelidium vagum]